MHVYSLKAGLSNGGKHAPFSELKINILEVMGLKGTICIGVGGWGMRDKQLYCEFAFTEVIQNIIVNW